MMCNYQTDGNWVYISKNNWGAPNCLVGGPCPVPNLLYIEYFHGQSKGAHENWVFCCAHHLLNGNFRILKRRYCTI